MKLSLINWVNIALVVMFGFFSSTVEGQVVKIKKTKKGYQYVDFYGRKLSKLAFEEAKLFGGIQGSYAAVKLNGKWGYVNQNIEIVIEPRFDDAQSFWSDRAIVKEGLSSYLIDRNGEISSRPYDSLVSYQEHYVAMRDSKYGVISKHDSILLDISFDSFGGKSDDGFIVKKEGQWGHYKDGVFNATDDVIAFTRFDVPAVFSSSCLEDEDLRSMISCSQRMMLTALYRNIVYPSKARGQKIEGTAVVRFRVNKYGEAEDFEITKDLGGGCGEEALRVVKKHLSKWARPAYLDNKPVSTYVNLPVKFKLA